MQVQFGLHFSGTGVSSATETSQLFMQLNLCAKSQSSATGRLLTAKSLSIALAAIMALNSSYNAEAAMLTDIDSSKNKSAILYLADKGVLAGYPDQTFKPNNVVNRAELLKILTASLGVSDLSGRNCFPDVTDQWFAPYVCYAKSRGWVSGYADGTFRPSEPVNKVEAIKMLVNAQGYKLDSANGHLGYTDVSSLDWYAPYVQASKSRNLLEEQTGNLGVSSGMTREKIAEIVYRATYVREKGLASFGQTLQSSSKSTVASSPSFSQVSSNLSSSSSVAAIDVTFAAELASWVGKGEQNIGIMQEFVDYYSQSSSHATAVAKVNTYLFEYRGLNAKIEIYADIAKTTPLSDAQREEIYTDRERMNELVRQFNDVFGTPTAE